MKVIFCLNLILIWSLPAFSMVPLEGIIYGGQSSRLVDQKFQGLLSYRYSDSDSDTAELVKLLNYRGMNRQGMSLAMFCEDLPDVNYISEWQAQSASRSIIGNLQFLGIDILSKAIAKFALKLEMNETDYKNLSENIVNNYCSPNFTVYSKKTIKDSLMSNFQQKTKFKLPSISESKYFPEAAKVRLGTLDSVKKQFHYSILNFRALCSWNGDESDYRLLVPYLQDPVIMSYVFNSIMGQKLSIDPVEREVLMVEDESAPKIACEDLICRPRKKEIFKRLFPRMVGSTRLQDDLNGLYCNRYAKARYRLDSVNAQVKKWIEEMTPYQRQLEVISLKSLITGIPDPLFALDKFSEIQEVAKAGVLERWNKWSNRQVDKVQISQLYEEPLEIELVSMIDTPEIRRGEFNVKFNIGLSEIDKVLTDVDKIDAYFNLTFENKYLASVRERLTFYYNRGDFINANQVTRSFERKIVEAIKDKEKYFNIKLSRADFAKILADELLGQLNSYRGRQLKKLSEKDVVIPVKFHYGLFALQYIHQKFIYEQKSQQVLTFK